MTKHMTSKRVKTLFGSFTYSPVGFCFFHKLCLTKAQMDKKHCLKRGCKAFKKYEQHPYWRQREKEKAIRDARKAKKKENLI